MKSEDYKTIPFSNFDFIKTIFLIIMVPVNILIYAALWGFKEEIQDVIFLILFIIMAWIIEKYILTKIIFLTADEETLHKNFRKKGGK